MHGNILILITKSLEIVRSLNTEGIEPPSKFGAFSAKPLTDSHDMTDKDNTVK
jgi:hypothetical protein